MNSHRGIESPLHCYIHRVLLVIVSSCILSTDVVFALDEEYTLTTRSGDSDIVRSRMVVRYQDETTHITIYENYHKILETAYRNKTILLHAYHYDMQGNLIISIECDFEVNRIMLARADSVSSFKLRERTYDNNGSLFYLFSQLNLPADGGTIEFNLLMPEQEKVHRFYVVNRGIERISVNNDVVDAYRYEMGLTGIAGLFWRHKYYYWYSIEDMHFLKYEGLGDDETMDIIEVIRHSVIE
jgi:hypothetical protein